MLHCRHDEPPVGQRCGQVVVAEGTAAAAMGEHDQSMLASKQSGFRGGIDQIQSHGCGLGAPARRIEDHGLHRPAAHWIFKLELPKTHSQWLSLNCPKPIRDDPYSYRQ
ncbi:hypothetical protein GKIL_0558 [Gloeobacter kilaueensis JS1]|uniref:Uncharacterized protein n=1 Tax=Gloeobacter kilaueensis (strain ATCC BAA-2537 / CCAP 1431/1 / ULC 316 / JS1) TaxID=1183438 RepID=U5QGT0_GLOK1|nr:hypothetical protein GKIL_0558 [Gloeobacter kilaueensis JS1]